jgi:hypothetical protein
MEIRKRTKVLEGSNCGWCDNATEHSSPPIVTRPTVSDHRCPERLVLVLTPARIQTSPERHFISRLEFRRSAEPEVVVILETRFTVGKCNSPFLQTADEFGRDAGITELPCCIPHVPATDITVRAAWSVSELGRPNRQVLRDRVL